MYKIGDFIIYGGQGVCKVEAVDTPDIFGIDKSKLYYTLFSVYNNEKIYTPIDTNVFMRSVITHAEAQQLISLIPSIEGDINNNHNLRMLEDHYKEVLQTYECSNLISLIKGVYIKKDIADKQGKKLGQIDARYMHKAEDSICGELAVALEMPKESVESMLRKELRILKT